MHRAAFFEKLTEIQRTVGQLLTELQANEHDKFAARTFGHLLERERTSFL